jgi:hypothetical protein
MWSLLVRAAAVSILLLLVVGGARIARAAEPSLQGDPGLVGLWILDAGSGTSIADSSGTGNNGTLMGDAAWLNTTNPAVLSFDGGSGTVQVPDSASLEPSASVSVAAWVEGAASPGTYAYIVGKGAMSCDTASYGLYSGANGGLQFYVTDNQGGSYYLSPDAGTGVWNGQWHLVVGTYDGSDLNLYVDGVLVGSGTPHTGPLEYGLPDSDDLDIGDYPGFAAINDGKDPGCATKDFTGLIGEAAVWNTALTPAQITALGQTATNPGGVTTGGGTTGGGTTGGGTTGGGTTGGGTTGGGTTGGGVTVRGVTGGTPVLSLLSLSPASLSSVTHHDGHTSSRKVTIVVSYTDGSASTTRFALQRREAGILQRGRCSVAHRRGAHSRACVAWVTIQSFVHIDHYGSNTFRILLLKGRHLAPGRYRVLATPVLVGAVGATISTALTIR